MSSHIDEDRLSPTPLAEPRKKQLAEALGKRYSELSKLWEDAEADLREIPIPVDVRFCYRSVITDAAKPGEDQIHSYLGFVRSKGGWRICYGTADVPSQFEIEWKPITECRVDIRLEAVPHIGKLRELVLKAGEECVPALDKAISDLRNALRTW
jgi:hypothetical protein